MKFLKNITLAALLGASMLYSQDEMAGEPIEPSEDGATPQQTAGNLNESWYTYWGIGAAFLSYSSRIENNINFIKSIPNVSRTSIDLDFLGLYFPVNSHKTLIGFIINGGADRFSDGTDYDQLNQYLYGLSLMHFPTSTAGHGFFIRGDVGVARVVEQMSGTTQVFSSDAGFGFLTGIGYGFNATPGTRILLNVNYSHKSVALVPQIGSEGYNKIAISLGGLF